MEEAYIFLSNSCILLKNKKKTVFEIYNEFKKYIPCYFIFLPIELKTEIVKKAINYNKKKLSESSRRFMSKSHVFISLLGREYNIVINYLFKKHPKILLEENLLFNKYVHSFIQKLNIKNIALYSWKNKRRRVLCFLDTPDMIKRFKFEIFSRLTVHKTETVISRIKHNNVPSFKKYYTEGIHLDGFRPIHYVNKKRISELFL
tara:strand:- start:2614 stop:3222 length:609 start_codon:yes stop_codon:yes gene_type:complete